MRGFEGRKQRQKTIPTSELFSSRESVQVNLSVIQRRASNWIRVLENAREELENARAELAYVSDSSGADAYLAHWKLDRAQDDLDVIEKNLKFLLRNIMGFLIPSPFWKPPYNDYFALNNGSWAMNYEAWAEKFWFKVKPEGSAERVLFDLGRTIAAQIYDNTPMNNTTKV